MGPLTLPGYGMNHNDEFWFSWSPQRKFRFARTMAVLFIVVALLARCALGGDGGEGGSDGASTTTTPTASTTTLSPTPTSVGAVDVATKLPAARYISSVARAGGKVMIVAGLDEKKNSTDTIWLFDPEAGTIADVGKFAAPVHAAAAAPLGDRALIMGGAKGDSVYSTVYAVDADGNVEGIGNLPAARAGATAVTSPDGSTVFVVGGYDGKTGSTEVLRTTDGVNFTAIATLNHVVRYPAVTVLDDTLWVVGGEYDNALSAAIQRIDLTTGAVTDLPELGTPVSRANAFTVGNSVFVAGGRTAGGGSSAILRFEPYNGGFVVAGNLPTPRYDAGIVVEANRAWLIGGSTPQASTDIVELTAS